jgi:hypothetical protein
MLAGNSKYVWRENSKQLSFSELDMPTKYIKKGSKNNWTEIQLAAAMDAVQQGKLSVRGASTKHGIPRSTLHDHLSGTSTKRYGGPSTVLTAEEEKEIVRSCLVMQEFGFPLNRELVSRVVKDFLADRDRSSLFTQGIPGRSWWSGFFRRHPQLVERKPEHLPSTGSQT